MYSQEPSPPVVLPKVTVNSVAWEERIGWEAEGLCQILDKLREKKKIWKKKRYKALTEAPTVGKERK